MDASKYNATKKDISGPKSAQQQILNVVTAMTEKCSDYMLGTNGAKIEADCADLTPYSSKVSTFSPSTEKQTKRLTSRLALLYELSRKKVSNSLDPYVIEFLDSITCFGAELSTETCCATWVGFYRELQWEPKELREDLEGMIRGWKGQFIKCKGFESAKV